MRVTIIPSDGFVSVDGVGVSGLDISLPKEIHAVQWYGEYGEAEIKDPITGKMTENRMLSSFDDFEPTMSLWRAAVQPTEE